VPRWPGGWKGTSEFAYREGRANKSGTSEA
jgi:hypothetical protein